MERSLILNAVTYVYSFHFDFLAESLKKSLNIYFGDNQYQNKQNLLEKFLKLRVQ